LGYDFAMVCAGEIMATTLEQIASFLDNRGWFYEVDKEARKRRGMYPS
jgi:dTDP-4-dehydrorhamnose 3,5-epimerase-like enzyme